MARHLTEAPITTRAARARLPLGVHWRRIDPETHLAYRKGKRGGVWFVRWRSGKGYKQAPLGPADDVIKVGSLAYEAAVRAARAAVEAARTEEKAAAEGPPLTVHAAVEAYARWRDERETRRAGRPAKSDATRRLTKYVIGREANGRRKAVAAAPLAAVPLYKLTDADLRKWREGMPGGMKETGVQRTVADLRAALNRAYERHRLNLNPRFPETVRIGLRADAGGGDDDEGIDVARGNQILTDGQIAALLRAVQEVDQDDGWGGDLFSIILTMAATGGRFAQLIRMRVADVQLAEKRLIVPTSRKGRAVKKVRSVAVPVGQDVLDALLPRITGRRANATLFERWQHVQVAGTIRWQRAGRGPWKTPSELVRPWQAARERAGLPGVIPYSLRHSSIVRSLRANLPIRLVAALHDTSVAMIERHYARYIADGLDDLAAAAVRPLVPTTEENVVPIAKRHR